MIGLGILLAALADPSALEAASSIPDVREQGCELLVKTGGQDPVIVPAPDIHVLEQPAKDGLYRPALPPGAIGVICQRNAIVPAEHDDEVPKLGLTFYIGEVGPESRVASLELINGSYRYRLLNGEFRPGEEKLVTQVLIRFENQRR